MTSGFQSDPARVARRQRADRIFTVLCWCVASVSVITLGVLLAAIGKQGLSHLNLSFLINPPSRDTDSAGLGPAIWGSVWICLTCALLALPLGIGTAVFLEEYKPTHWLVCKAHGFVQLNITNLAGVPSIVYGILGLTVFVSMFNLGNANDPAWTIGQSWYDYVLDAANEPYFVPVTSRDAPPTQLTATQAFRTESGEIADLQIIPSDILEARVLAIHDAVGQITTEIDEGVSDGAMQPQEIRALVGGALEGTTLQADTGLLTDEVTRRLTAAIELEGRHRQRSVRRALRTILQEELRVQVGGLVPSDVVPTRMDRKSWYYLQIPFGRGVLAGGFTLMLVVLPIVIISSQEALRSVPSSLREGALGMGSTKWQMIWRMTLPASIPGIMTGAILAMGRAIGEAAPILILAGIVYITFTPTHLMDDFTAMPLQIFDWAGRPQRPFHEVAASGIVVLLAILLLFNATAVFIRQRFQKPMQ